MSRSPQRTRPRRNSELTDDELWALEMETKTALYYLEEGLRGLHDLDQRNDFFPAPFLLLSQGFERLLKCLSV
jgi:hypothetical protein